MSAPSLPESFLTRPIAHRGLHGPDVPENSRASVVAALTAGYAVEIDLQVSSDGVPKVFHDGTLDRMTASAGLVRLLHSEELQRISLKETDEGIPRFSEILDLVDGQAPLLVELKDQTGGFWKTDGGFERAVAEVARDYAGDLAFMSFSPALVAGMARAAPERPRGLVTEIFGARSWPGVPEEKRLALTEIRAAQSVGAGFVSHDWRTLDLPQVAAIKARGLPVLCWTVRSAEEEALARRYAHNITFEGYLPSGAS